MTKGGAAMQADRGELMATSAGSVKVGHLPPLQLRDMPEPHSLRKMVGPGVVLIAVGLGSGEYISHPYITSQVGLTFVWAAALGIAIQYFINTEIARYTLATGETIVTGFTRLWRYWGPLFIVMTVVPFAWPGWMTAAATMVTFTAGGGDVTVIAIVGLIAIGLTLTLSPIVYKTVERLEFLKVLAILAFIIFAIAFIIGWRPWAELPSATVEGFGRLPAGVPTTVLITAMVFAGGGGAVNLAVSNWIRDKGWGMGVHAPRVVSPITGSEEAGTGTGFQFSMTDANLSRWNAWWRNARVEQFWTFGVVGVLSIVVFSLIAYRVLPVGTYGGAPDLSFIQLEGELLGQRFGDAVKTFFWLIGAVALMFANLVVVDLVGRITADVLAVNYLRDSAFWSEAKIYALVVWLEVALGLIILGLGVTQPIVLLAIAAILNGVVMVVYCALLVQLNRGLDARLRIRSLRIGVMALAMIFYGSFAAYTINDQVRALF